MDKVEFYADGSLLGSDDSSPYSFDWNTSGVADGEYALMAKAYDPSGNVASDNDTTVTVANGGGGSTTTVQFTNNDSQDGYVKAANGGSGAAVGTFESFYGLAIGRGSDGKFNRSFLSFDTSSIPDGATIVDAYITVTRNSSSGSPWSNPAGNQLVIDVNTGCFGGCSTETGDWGASADAAGVAELLAWQSGDQSSGSFNASGRNAINKTGTTQLRLRFTSDQTSTAYLFIDNGASASLTVTYQ